MRRLLTQLLLGLVLAVATSASSATASDAVLQIVVTAEGNKGRFGTGFFWNERGQIITAYHVVAGAQRIRVIDAAGRAHEKVMVTHIQPDADLALLHVPGLQGPTAFIPFSGQSPTVTDELRTIGSPRGIAQQTFVGRVTSDRLVPSDQMRDTQGRMIFRADAQRLDLLPLDITIYTGMSGGPVMLGGKAVAVLVASLNEGGALAWGIPIKYISGSQWTAVNKEAPRVSWPTFNLLSEGARSLEVLVSFAAADGALLDTYLSQGKQLEDLMSVMINQYSQCQVTMDVWLRLQLKGEAKAAVADPLQADIEGCMQTLLARLGEIASVEDRLAITHDKISAAVRQRRDTGAPKTRLVQIGQPLPSAIGVDIEPVMTRLISRMNTINANDERARVQLIKEIFESMQLDSSASVAHMGAMFYDLRMIAVYFNRLILQ
ncbi:MAG: hypothetical protein A3E25_22865 [Burkholderiales bacterium RIFCSPHIGHO2_12_FULL_69_20]|nr:MAG: hypothetical protein A3E25_22865 [Burkholderiales bacterium RIFCSPHIGHO2_12_FULL_69_20]